jgi:5-formyltetrahydrofolate cyclo-ligase
MKSTPKNVIKNDRASYTLQQQRQTIRKRRLALSPEDRSDLGQQICQRALQTLYYNKAQNLALYLSALGEVETQSLIDQALSHGKHVYLPALDPINKERMYFVHFQPGTRLVENRFGMAEPELKEENVISPKHLDLVICPLVAFDEQANRVGMGGGFYDRHFAFKNEIAFASKPPFMLGLGYDFQKIQKIDVAPWDIPMDAIISEAATYLPRKN